MTNRAKDPNLCEERNSLVTTDPIKVQQPGNVLLSQEPALQVPSALEGLTVVFEMGTSVSPPPSLPD
jgi:hypothetical protein